MHFDQLHIESTGYGQPLVLLHGWGWHSGIWQPLLPFLIDKFEVYFIDLPGFGKNDKVPIIYDIENISHLIIDVLPSKPILLGWSLGGMIAWHIATRYPESLSHLITVGTSAKFIESENWPGVKESVLLNFKKSLMHNYQQTLEDFLTLQLRGSKKSIEHNKLIEIMLSPPPTIAGLLGGFSLLQNLDLRNDLNKVNCPSLHLFGSHDVLVPSQVSGLIKNQNLAARCEVFNRCGHMPFLSHREEFLRILFDFVKTTHAP